MKQRQLKLKKKGSKALLSKEMLIRCQDLAIVGTQQDWQLYLRCAPLFWRKIEHWVNTFINADLMDYDYLLNYGEIAGKNLEEYTSAEVLTALSYYICANRWQKGIFLQMIANGTIEKLVRHLQKY